MKELFQKFRKPLIMLGIFVAVFTIYTLFIKKDSPTADLEKIRPDQSVTVEDNKELLSQLQALNAISLNTEIFNSSLFKTLQDNTIVIENRKPEGRRNPFLPIGQDDGTFTPDQSIVNATNNTNGLLNQPVQNPNAPKPELSKNVQSIKATTTPVAAVKPNSTSTKPAN